MPEWLREVLRTVFVGAGIFGALLVAIASGVGVTAVLLHFFPRTGKRG